MPLKDRRRIYQSSIDDAERMSAYAGLLVSTHFSAFLSAEAAPEFVAAEDARRARLSQDVEHEAGARLEADYAVLKALDLLSLAGGLTPPGSDKESWPRWLVGVILIDSAETELRWRDEQTLVVDPFPLRREVQVSLPFVEVETRRFADDAELRDAIRNGERGSATVRFVGVTGC
jgi:hypothetical protein